MITLTKTITYLYKFTCKNIHQCGKITYDREIQKKKIKEMKTKGKNKKNFHPQSLDVSKLHTHTHTQYHIHAWDYIIDNVYYFFSLLKYAILLGPYLHSIKSF